MKGKNKTHNKRSLRLRIGWSMLLHSVFNQRLAYSWICLELVLVTVFTWNVADPLYHLTMNLAIPDGFDRDHLYILSTKHKEVDFQSVSPELADTRWEQLNRLLQEHPDVAIAQNSMMQNIFGSNCTVFTPFTTDSIMPDSSNYQVMAQKLEYFTAEGTDIIGMYGLTILPSERTAQPENNMVWLSQSLAQKLYGTTDCVGRRIKLPYNGVVAGVFRDLKPSPYRQPEHLGIVCYNNKPAAAVDNRALGPTFLIKLKDGAKPERLGDDIADIAEQAGYAKPHFNVLAVETADSEERNTCRLMSILSSFGLACVLLGMLGTFWMRCATRRGDIAVMRAMGATRMRVVCHFLAEAALLVTMACIIAAPVICAQVYLFGVYGIGEGKSDIYAQNVLWSHCLHLALLTYSFLLTIALIGAAIPVSQAVRELPSEGLKEE